MIANKAIGVHYFVERLDVTPRDANLLLCAKPCYGENNRTTHKKTDDISSNIIYDCP